MKIIKKTIQDVDEKNSVFYILARKMSCNYGVNIVVRTFSYEVDNNESIKFTIKNLQEIFYDCTGKEFDFKKVAGDIIVSDYSEARNTIFVSFSDKESTLSSEEINEYTTMFWQEVATHFMLPPTHVFFHSPDHDSLFDYGIFWTFCYIFLNNNTKQGIVLQADSFD